MRLAAFVELHDVVEQEREDRDDLGDREEPCSVVASRYSWAELLRRVFEVEVLVCPHCGGARRLLAAIHDPASIELRQSAPRQAGRVGVAGDGSAARGAGGGEGQGTAG